MAMFRNRGAATQAEHTAPTTMAPIAGDFGEFVEKALGPTHVERLKRKADLPKQIKSSEDRIADLEQRIQETTELKDNAEDEIRKMKAAKKGHGKTLRRALIRFALAGGMLLGSLALAKLAYDQVNMVSVYLAKDNAKYNAFANHAQKVTRKAVNEIATQMRDGNTTVINAVDNIAQNTAPGHKKILDPQHNAITLSNIAFAYAYSNNISPTADRALNDATHGNWHYATYVNFPTYTNVGLGNDVTAVFGGIGAAIDFGGAIFWTVTGYRKLYNYKQDTKTINANIVTFTNSFNSANQEIESRTVALEAERSVKENLEAEMREF